MSNKEYLKETLSRFMVTDQEIILIMLNQGIDPDKVVTQGEVLPLKKAIYDQLPLMLAGMQNVKEGGYSITWNLEGIKFWYSALASELGLPDLFNPTPTISSVSPW